MNESDGLVVLPHVKVQNVNAISGPLSWGFPPPSAFLGFVHALQRKLTDAWGVKFTGAGIICHRFEPQIHQLPGSRQHVFALSRHPIRAGYKKFEDKDASIVEEARAHMEVSLILDTSTDAEVADDFLASLQNEVHSMRIGGGGVIPSFESASAPLWFPWGYDEEENSKQFRKLCRLLLPGFALVQRQDLLDSRLAELRESDSASTSLDALCDLCALHAESKTDDLGKVEWYFRREPGWLVPLPVGYGALSEEIHEGGEVANARDKVTPFRFVESLYSLGEWVSLHRINDRNEIMWRYESHKDEGIYLCANTYSSSLTDKE